MFKAIIYVTLKENVLDPQGVAVRSSLHTMGYENVTDVRMGKQLELMLNSSDRTEAEGKVREMCEKLLSNPVMEDFYFELEEVSQ